jgi:cholesterol 7-dehydrogenase
MILIVSISIVLYLVYLYYFKYHEVIMKGDYEIKLKNIGRTLPPFPNGWYIACKSQDIAVGESKAIDQSGHNVTVFRAKSGKLYALHSYCAHLGANLGIGGKVIN